MIARKIVLEVLGNKCEKCENTTNLKFFHRDGNKKNNEIGNIQLLCQSCYLEVSSEIPKPKTTEIMKFALTIPVGREIRNRFVKKGDLSTVVEIACRRDFNMELTEECLEYLETLKNIES